MAKKPKRERNRKLPAELQELRPDRRIFALVRRGRNPIWKQCFPNGELPEPHLLPKFRPNSVRKLCETMMDTMVPAEFAAQSMGFTLEEFHGWMKLGIEHMENNIESPEAYFAYHVGRTQAKVVALGMKELRGAGAGIWQKWAWILERSFTHFKNHPPAGKTKVQDKGVIDQLADLWLTQAMNPTNATPLPLPEVSSKGNPPSNPED